MAKPKSKGNKLKRLYDQLKKHSKQQITHGRVTLVDKGKDTEHAEYREVLTRRGRIESSIKRLENTK